MVSRESFGKPLACSCWDSGLWRAARSPTAARRTGAMRGDQLPLNGRPIELTGFGMHEDFPIHGLGLDLPGLQTATSRSSNNTMDETVEEQEARSAMIEFVLGEAYFVSARTIEIRLAMGGVGRPPRTANEELQS